MQHTASNALRTSNGQPATVGGSAILNAFHSDVAQRGWRGWSDDLKQQTRDAVEGRDIFAPRDGQLCLKHIASGFGTIAQEHLWGGVLTVVDRRTGTETCYANADELIAAGWVVD